MLPEWGLPRPQQAGQCSELLRKAARRSIGARLGPKTAHSGRKDEPVHWINVTRLTPRWTRVALGIMSESKAELSVKLISELVAEPDFPKSALGQTVDIKGYVGVVVQIVNNSIKVRSAEGNTMSYNFNALRRLYGPRITSEPERLGEMPISSVPAEPEVKRQIILDPNFDSAAVPIESVVHRPDFPQCAFGVLVDLHGYAGVVVELVGHSLKVRSREGTTRSYNADGLRKIYTPVSAPNSFSAASLPAP